MDIMEKLTILTNSAKYDVACTSSGVDRGGAPGSMGSTVGCGICHSFASDGRCISLLKVLMTNYCIYDCQYCVNRCSNDTKRVAFTPEELAELTMAFYRRNYIEGLFLSSGILKSPDYTSERLLKTLLLIRNKYHFRGYIHVKAIPGTDPALLTKLGMLADRMSVNIELPSQKSLRQLAPNKSKNDIFAPMKLLTSSIRQNSYDLAHYKSAPAFAPSGQSTQMIVGASPESDFQILSLAQGLYQKYRLKRVFYSAYMPVSDNPLLPARGTKPPLLREHRLYQADWLLRFYGFKAEELLDEEHPNINPLMDPKCNWALNHLERFPQEVNTAPYEMLLRIPGVGVKSAKRIMTARRNGSLSFEDLKKIGVVLKRAQYFITCSGKLACGLKITQDGVLRALIGDKLPAENKPEQLSLFAPSAMLLKGEIRQCLGVRT